MNARRAKLCVGLDVGSTTVKAVVLERSSRQILWRSYRRHETRQLEVAEAMLEDLCRETGAQPGRDSIFLTGTGGQVIAEATDTAYVQEVNAVSTAARELFPECRSIVELGGQDAKIIIFREQGGELRRHASMNDKCAGGTGAVVDKLGAKLGFDAAGLRAARYAGLRIHPVAGKCGVFAETDLIGLQKQGVPEDELLASLYDAIVLQNLSVLTRGFTLQPQVLLIGGPHAFLPGLVEAWRHAIPRTWRERGIDVDAAELPRQIAVPDGAEDFAALGAVLAGLEEERDSRLLAPAAIQRLATQQRVTARTRQVGPPLVADRVELDAFHAVYRQPPFETARFRPGQKVQAVLGIDGGSTSTKAVLIDADGLVLAKAYKLSCGNPIADVKELAATLQGEVDRQGAQLEVRACATTGYASSSS